MEKHRPVNILCLQEKGIAPASRSPSNRARLWRLWIPQQRWQMGVLSAQGFAPAPPCLPAQQRCRICTGILKMSCSPHGGYFIEGRFKFGDQIPLLFAKLFFSSLLWKRSLNKAKEDATGIFKICWHISVHVNPFRAVVGVPWPHQHRSRFTRIWCWRHQVGHSGTDGRTDRQTDRGRTGTPEAAQLPQPEGSRTSQISLSAHTDNLRAWPKTPRFKLPWVFCQICDVSLIQVRKM